MPLASERALLRNRFVPKDGLPLLTRLSLFSDRIEVHRLGKPVRVIPLAKVEDVSVSSWPHDSINLRLQVRDEEPLEGRVEAALAWKYQLHDLLGLKALPKVALEPTLQLAAAA